MRLLTWNICHGGGTRRTPEVLLYLLATNADIIVLTEFRTALGGQLAGVLADHGWAHQLTTSPPSGVNGILIASRSRLTSRPAPTMRLVLDDRDNHKLLACTLPDLDLAITAAHVPDASWGDAHRQASRAAHWHAVLHAARGRPVRHIVLGDFNTGRHRLDEPGSTFSCTALLGQLATLGYVDAWRHLRGAERASTWFSHDHAGFRIDQAWFSRDLAGFIQHVEHDDVPRRAGWSDHAPVIVDLRTPDANNAAAVGEPTVDEGRDH